MKRDHGPPAEGPTSLHRTHWTVVLKAAAKALEVSLGAAKSLIHCLRKRCASILREEVARTVSDPAEIDAEIHALCTALIVSGGSLDP